MKSRIPIQPSAGRVLVLQIDEVTAEKPDSFSIDAIRDQAFFLGLNAAVFLANSRQVKPSSIAQMPVVLPDSGSPCGVWEFRKMRNRTAYRTGLVILN